MAKGSAEISHAGAPFDKLGAGSAPQTQGPSTRAPKEGALSRDGKARKDAGEGARATPKWLSAAQKKMESELAAKYGEGQRERARRGLKQAGEFWRTEDGDQPAFEAFARANFAGDQATLDTTFARFQRLMEQLAGRRPVPRSRGCRTHKASWKANWSPSTAKGSASVRVAG